MFVKWWDRSAAAVTDMEKQTQAEKTRKRERERAIRATVISATDEPTNCRVCLSGQGKTRRGKMNDLQGNEKKTAVWRHCTRSHSAVTSPLCHFSSFLSVLPNRSANCQWSLHSLEFVLSLQPNEHFSYLSFAFSIYAREAISGLNYPPNDGGLVALLT